MAQTLQSKSSVKQTVIDSMDTIRGMSGFRVADIGFFLNAMPATITQALEELVAEGHLRVIRKAGRVNVYGAAL